MRGHVAAFVLVALFAVAAHGDAGSDALSRAQAHFETGRGFFRLGSYEDALKQFVAGYELVPRPQFLLNMGQCFRKLGRLTEARAMFTRYLDAAPADESERAQVQALIAEIERAIAASPPPATPQAEPEPARAPAQIAPVQLATTPPPPLTEKKSFVRRHWWIFPVAGAVLAGVAVGVYFAARPPPGPSCTAAAYGCIDLRR